MIFNVFLVASKNTRTNITLPRMIPNDNYANPQELEMYDSIMTLKDLRLPVAMEYYNQSPVSVRNTRTNINTDHVDFTLPTLTINTD